MFFMGVNTLFNALMHTPGFRSDRLLAPGRPRWRAAWRCRAASPRAGKQLTGCAITQGWGLTEASPVGCCNKLIGPDAEFNGSIGLPLPSTEITIRDDEGRELGIGEVGEICLRGPQVMRGYWQRPEETAKVMLPEGWLRTGDIGRIDARGFVFIEDRKKDMIIVSGFKVYPERDRGCGGAVPRRARGRRGRAARRAFGRSGGAVHRAQGSGAHGAGA